MNIRYLIGGLAIVGFLIIAFFSFQESKIDYADFSSAIDSGRLVQVSGTWNKEKNANYDSEHNKFVFYMVDEKNKECKVVYEGGKPNNFEIATTIVIKGKYKEDEFHASDILTKCPSKYEGQPEELHKKAMQTAL